MGSISAARIFPRRDYSPYRGSLDPARPGARRDKGAKQREKGKERTRSGKRRVDVAQNLALSWIRDVHPSTKRRGDRDRKFEVSKEACTYV